MIQLTIEQLATLRDWFLPDRPGPLIGLHLLATGHGSAWVDRWPQPRALYVESAKNASLLGDPAALTPEMIRPVVVGFIEASAGFIPLLKATFPDLVVWDRVIAALPSAPTYQQPAGFTLRRLTSPDAEHLAQLSDESFWISKTWGGPAGLAASGYAWGAFIGLRKSTVLIKLLELLTRQLGQEVSYQEVGQALKIDRRTVVSYIDLLEQCFILFRLGAFSRNLRKEVTKSVKIYFYDLGVRNCLIQNFTPLALRNDVGALWENFCIVERLKVLHYRQQFANQYFWRTYDQQEIDYLEERNGLLHGYEFKWSPTAKMKEPTDFLQTYPGSQVDRIDRSNYWRFLF